MTVLRFLVLSLAVAPLWIQGETRKVAPTFQEGVQAYRRGDYASAEAYWREVLEEELPDEIRARVLYDLGNAAWRQEKPMEAIGWYTACLRLAPRHSDAWANLEFVRAQEGLDPADRGDLKSTLVRALTALRPEEARALALLGWIALATGFAIEVFRGGRLGRRAIAVGMVVAAVASLPLAWRALHSETDPLLVIRSPSVSLRAEPRSELAPIGELQAGERVERLDALPGWVRIEKSDGTRGWAPEEALFPLDP